MKIIAIALVVIILLVGIGYWGFHVAPKPFEPYPGTTPELKTLPLPAGLPAPVKRFYQSTAGDQVPVVDTAVITMHGSMKLFGIRMPMRSRVVHKAGQGFWRIMQPTFFGYPIATLLDTYWDGVAHLDMPGIQDNDPKMNSASNLVLWAEATAFPGILLTDPRVKWEGIDDTHARLVVPSPEGTDSMTFTFDEATGLITAMECQRWRDPSYSAKSTWRTTSVPADKQLFGGMRLDAAGVVAWNDEAPWFERTTDEVLYNVDIMPFIQANQR